MIFQIENISFSYPGSAKKVLKEASLQLKAGEILSILGPNGAGKTTLLNCMAGLLSVDSGTIQICGEDITSMDKRKIASLIGYVPQTHTPAFDYKVLDFVLMGRAPKIGMFGRPNKEDEVRCMDILRDMRIDHLAERSYLDISGGERQQVLIARTIVQEPKAILFDEPTAHLDYGNQHRVLKLIRQMAGKGYSIVITTHNPDHALLLGDQAAIVTRAGTILSGSTEEIITESSLCELYETDLKLMEVAEIQRTTCLVPKL